MEALEQSALESFALLSFQARLTYSYKGKTLSKK